MVGQTLPAVHGTAVDVGLDLLAQHDLHAASLRTLGLLELALRAQVVQDGGILNELQALLVGTPDFGFIQLLLHESVDPLSLGELVLAHGTGFISSLNPGVNAFLAEQVVTFVTLSGIKKDTRTNGLASQVLVVNGHLLDQFA